MAIFPGPVLAEALNELERAVDALSRQFQRPLYLGEPSRGRFRYVKPNSQVLQVLKAVRVVSGFHAAIHLAVCGHHQEAAVVLRSVDEALQDIDVLDEAHHNPAEATAYQQRLVDEFFASDDAERVDAMLAGSARPVPRVPRKKKRATIEQRLSKVSPGKWIRPGLDTIDAVLDGYVHCGYSQIMELYSASPYWEGFHMQGLQDPGRLAMMAAWVPRFVYHALNAVARLLRDAKLSADAERLVALRDRLETSPEYGRG